MCMGLSCSSPPGTFSSTQYTVVNIIVGQEHLVTHVERACNEVRVIPSALSATTLTFLVRGLTHIAMSHCATLESVSFMLAT